jgi:phosphoribosylformimino-5-aminoimidazole carboxamide ribotide isomerase
MEIRRDFRVIPAVDLKEGKCVTLIGGDPGKRITEIEDPVETAITWEGKGASLLHLIDLDGAIGGVPANMHIVEKITESLKIPVQFGGGIRSLESAARILDYGVHRIILGTLAFKSPEVLEKLAREYGSDRVMVALDFKGNQVVTHGWTSRTALDPVSAAKKFEALGAGSILHTNVDVEGRLQGIPLEPILEMVASVDIGVVASGGVTTIEDLHAIRSTGASGAIVGAAIYTGRINLEEAIRKVEEEIKDAED